MDIFVLTPLQHLTSSNLLHGESTEWEKGSHRTFAVPWDWCFLVIATSKPLVDGNQTSPALFWVWLLRFLNFAHLWCSTSSFMAPICPVCQNTANTEELREGNVITNNKNHHWRLKSRRWGLFFTKINLVLLSSLDFGCLFLGALFHNGYTTILCSSRIAVGGALQRDRVSISKKNHTQSATPESHRSTHLSVYVSLLIPYFLSWAPLFW